MNSMDSAFTEVSLHNRVNQPVKLMIRLAQLSPKLSCVFIKQCSTQASSLVAKNSEVFAKQLVTLFDLPPETLELLELKASGELVQYRFNWVELTPLMSRAETVEHRSRKEFLLSQLDSVA